MENKIKDQPNINQISCIKIGFYFKSPHWGTAESLFSLLPELEMYLAVIAQYWCMICYFFKNFETKSVIYYRVFYPLHNGQGHFCHI